MSRDYRIEINQKPVQVHVSDAAETQLSRMDQPLCVEMELYFSCLIRKQVHFPKALDTAQAVLVNNRLMVAFHPVMTAACGKDFEGDKPPLTEFPMAKVAPYVPKWLKLDYRHGNWQGEFGYD